MSAGDGVDAMCRELWDFGWKHPLALIPAHLVVITLWLATSPVGAAALAAISLLLVSNRLCRRERS